MGNRTEQTDVLVIGGGTAGFGAAIAAGRQGLRVTLRSGTLVDATIIDVPSSTKNKAEARDPEMSSAKKGND